MRDWVLCLMVCLFTGCGAEEVDEEARRADDVVRGARDRGRHPAVVAIRSSDGRLCTGALIASGLVLTARHCVSVTRDRIDCAARRQVFGERPASSFVVVTDEDGLSGPIAARVDRVVVPATERLCGADVALLVLDRELRGIVPLALDARVALPAGDVVTVVGYGRRGDSSRAGIGMRYTRANVRVEAVSEREMVTGEGTCAGDSGSPALDARTGRVVGVLSRGGERCVGDGAVGVWTRPSVAVALINAVR